MIIRTIAVAVAIALAFASPSWADETSDWLQSLSKRAYEEGQKKWPTPPPTKDEKLGRPGQRTVGQCFVSPGWVSGEGKKVPDDPFEDEEGFTCMLRRGYRYCPDCASSKKTLCKRTHRAPLDNHCWKSTTFPDPHPMVEHP